MGDFVPTQRLVVARTGSARGTRSHASQRPPRRTLLLAAASAGAAWVSGPAGAQKGWPTRPLRLICGQPPGGLAESRKRWKEDAPQWIAMAERTGVKFD